jgi:acetyltransferase
MWGEFRGDSSVSAAGISELLNKLNGSLLRIPAASAIECNPVMSVGHELIAVDAAIEFFQGSAK